MASIRSIEVHFWLAARNFAQAYAESWILAPRRLRAMIAWSEPLPDNRKPVKARATRARLRRLAALTGSRPPGSLPPSAHGSRERGRSRGDASGDRSVARRGLRSFCRLATGATLAPWLAPKNRGDNARQVCDALRLCTTSRGSDLDVAGWSGYPSIAALSINRGIDVMCHDRTRARQQRRPGIRRVQSASCLLALLSSLPASASIRRINEARI